MANYRAVANGNWSSLATWQDDSLGYFANSSVLPTSADDVYSNNFTVTIDGTRNANTIRNTAFTPPTNLALMSIPQMSSNTTPSGAAAASSAAGGTAAWNAFDRNTGTIWNTPSGTNTGWLSYQFPTGKIIKRYGFFSDSNNAKNPRTWTFEGSNNGSTWVTIDTQTNFITGVSTFYSFDISANTTSYTYYRINVTATQGGSTVAIAELEMSEVTNLYGGIVAGGQFKFANGGNLTCAASNAIAVGNTTPTLLFDLASGNSATFNGNCNHNFAVTSSTLINFNGTGTFNILGNLDISFVGGSVGTRRTLSINSNGIINIIGNIDCASNQTNTVNTIDVNSNCILRISTLSTYNLTGNTIAGTNAAISSTVTTNINVVGNTNGSASAPAILNTTAPATIDLLGVTTSGSGSPAVQGLLTTFVKVRGNVIHTDTYAAIYAGRVVIDNNVTSWQFKDSTNTVTRTLYTAGVALGNPATTNVRSGVTYGPSLELTGTLIVPNPSNVLFGVPTDNTTGTYSTTPALIATEIFTKLLSSTDFNTSGSFGKLVKDNLDAQVSSRLATASYVAPDNADIAAIKAVTDTLTDVATETTSLAIKTKTDLIPNNPASVESVGAIVASYNI